MIGKILKRTTGRSLRQLAASQYRQFSEKIEDIAEEEELSEEQQEMLNALNEYSEGLKSISEKNWLIAENNLSRVLNIMERIGSKKTREYLHIKKKLAFISMSTYQYEDAEKHLNDCIDLAQDITNNPYTLYKNYGLLFDLYLQSNLEKAILLGKALNSEEEREDIPYILQKEFSFSLGTAYLLNGNINDAKTRLRECLNAEPNSELRGYALNNLALCYWWQKIPCYDEQRAEVEVSDIDLDREWESVVPMMKKSMSALEDVDKIEDMGYRMRLQNLFDETTLGPTEEKEFSGDELFTHPKTVKVINNTAEFIMRYKEENLSSANLWMMCASKLNNISDDVDFARVLSLIAIMNSQEENFITSEGLFNAAKDILADKICYERVETLKFYSLMLENFDNRETEAAQNLDLAKQLSENLPFWAPKMMNVITIDQEF